MNSFLLALLVVSMMIMNKRLSNIQLLLEEISDNTDEDGVKNENQ